MKIVIINGHPGAGKDEFVKQCASLTLPIQNVSTVDFVKTIATQCGWDGGKTPKNRAFLSDLKDLLTTWDDVPYRKVMDQIYQYEAFWDGYGIDTDEAVVFVHCREPKEIAKFVERNDAITLFIRRPTVDNNIQSNHADAEVENYNYDFYIDNNGTIEDLKDKAKQFLSDIGVKEV